MVVCKKRIKKRRKGIRWQIVPEDKIIGLYYDFMFCQVFGDSNLSFANKMWHTYLDEREEKVFLWCQLMNTEDLATFRERGFK